MSNKFMYGSPILLGSSTTPGVQIPPELKKVIPDILKSCTDFGLDYYPPIIQMLTHDEMSEVASYGGFGVRYPHWKWGMEYEEMQRGYMHGMHKIYEMVVNCCFSATRILTKRGTIQADQVVKGDYVIGQKGWRKVAAVVRQKKSELRKIELKNQFRSLICTSNHKWLVAKKDGFQWVESENIVVGDLIVGCDTSDNFKGSPASFNIDESRAYTSTPKNLHHCIKKIKIPNQMTEELAELIGVILGDGSIGVKSAENNIVVAVGKKHKDYAEHVANLFFSVFGQEAKVYEKPNCFAVTFCSKSAVDFFDQIDLPKGCTFKNKRIPQVIFSSSHEYRVALLRGLFDTDGYCGKSGIRYSSKSKRLIEEIQLILSELGIYTAARHVVNNHNDIYTLEISGRIAAAKFAAVISLRQRYKQESLIKNASKAKCSAGGVKVEFLQQQLVEISKNIKSYSFPKIYYSRKLLTQKNVGLNTLCAFIENMEQHKFEVPESLKKYVNTPYYEVTQNSVYGIDESIDIALHHEDHDFVAEGFMSHNTNPCYIYCLNSNTLLDNVTVIAHALGHSHFFKNNLFFQHTNKNMLNEFANHGTRIRRYMSRWGKERVIEFIDHVLRVETLVDNAKAWNTRQVKEPIIRDHRKYRQPRRMQTDKSRMYMDDWINTKDFVDAEHKRIEKADKADELGLMLKPEKDIFGWIRENANLKPWQSDIMAMLYEEAMYYAPQGMTKMHNEGHACLVSGQYVFTDSGMITADKIVVDKMECNVFDGEVQQKVVNHFVFENRKTYKITTKRGYVIHGSDTHRIFDKNKNWIRLDEVKIGDQAYIAAGSNIWAQGYVELNYQDFERITGRQVAELAGCSFDTVRRRMAGENTRINSKLDDLILNYKNQLETHGRRKQKPQIDANIPTIVDENLGEFLGYLIGDGHISISGRCFGLTTADYDMVVKFSSLVENIFGLECKIKKIPGKYRVHAYSRKVERFLVSLGLTTGVSARQKSIPDCILRSPKSVISKFISALLDCDGYGGKGGVILSTSSKKMASQIQLLFLNYGIVSSITNQPKDILHVRFGGSYLKLFVKEIGFGLKRKQDKLQKFIDSHQWFCKTYDYDTVVKIEEGRHTVYDISVENTHRYAAQGFINHNSWVDYNIIAKQGLCALGQESHDHGIVEYAKHKMGVLGGKYSTNPYKLGFCLLTEIEERWNKGMFGNEWEDVSSYKEKENWDKKLGLGKEKVFEIAKLYDDVNLINEYFDQDFCDKYQFFDWQKQENGEYVVQSKDANVIKRKLIEKYSNRGLPTINLVDNNHLGKGIMLLEHVWNGRTLYIPYVNETLGSINFLTGRPVLLASKNKNGEEIVFYCEGFGDSQIHQLTRLQYKREFGISV